ncbi:MAG: 50S ribosomal protein L4 [Bacteroidia bacterium]|nr:50S ribosomal protein L4 [Bacteroidia bacterium]
MASIKVLNLNGKETSKEVDLPESVFGIEPNDHCIYLDVKAILANKRQGTHKTKERAEVNRTTKKFKRQKGTGGARAGSMKSPLFIGGGTVFGPKPRDYSMKINKKVKQLARKSVLTYKARENKITVLENFTFDKPRTKNFVELLKNIGLDTHKTLFILPDSDKNIYLSARNIPKTNVLPAQDINTYDILNADSLVIVESAIEKIEKLLNN